MAKATAHTVVIVVLLAASVAVTPVSAQGPSCAGLPATIVATPGVATVGTDSDDVIVGTPGADHISGRDGNDTICGLGGADVIKGNNGRDHIRAGEGPDRVHGGHGADVIIGGGGHDELSGNSGHDIIEGRSGRDVLKGGGGSDRLNGGLGSDRCNGSDGFDSAQACETVDAIEHVEPQVGPLGRLETVRPVAGGAEVMGWAVSTDGGTSRPLVEISADGELLERFHPTDRRFDIRAVFGRRSDPAGFQVMVDVPPGSHTVCADAVNQTSGTRMRIGCGASDPDAAAAEEVALRGLLRDLGLSAENELAGVRVALAVVPFDRGQLVHYRGNRLFISASAAKAWWTAAALANGRSEDATEIGPTLFRTSSDALGGLMIDLAGGIDAVNDFTLDAGMTDTAVIGWSIGGVTRRSTAFPGPLNGSSYVDASDAATFFYQLGTGQVLHRDMAELLAEWMRQSPRDTHTGPSEASTIPDSLPPAVKKRVEQKAGWLPSGAYSVPGHLLGVGIVHPDNGASSYAIALMGKGGNRATYARLIEFFQSASCQIYRHIATDHDWTCPRW